MPYVVVADDAFPLKPYIMKPFAFRQQDMNQRVLNYRLSRARRIIENVFGICAARFRILRRPIDFHPSKATKIVLAICALHNFLMERKSVYTTSNDFDRELNGQTIPDQWRALAEGNGFLFIYETHLNNILFRNKERWTGNTQLAVIHHKL